MASTVKPLYHNPLIITYKEGDESLYRAIMDIDDDVNDKTYTVRQDDTLLSIAHRFYKNSKGWYIIADKNNIDDIFNLEVGSRLIIPNHTKLL